MLVAQAYGDTRLIDPGHATEFDIRVLTEGLEAKKAWDIIHDPAMMEGLTMDGVLALMQRAGYPENVAQRTASRHGLDRLTSNKSP